MIELDSLYERKRNLEDRIEHFFDGELIPHYGDRGYQDLCEQLDDVEEQINELTDDE